MQSPVVSPVPSMSQMTDLTSPQYQMGSPPLQSPEVAPCETLPSGATLEGYMYHEEDRHSNHGNMKDSDEGISDYEGGAVGTAVVSSEKHKQYASSNMLPIVQPVLVNINNDRNSSTDHDSENDNASTLSVDVYEAAENTSNTFSLRLIGEAVHAGFEDFLKEYPPKKVNYK